MAGVTGKLLSRMKRLAPARRGPAAPPPASPRAVAPVLSLPQDAPATLLAVWHDRALFAAPPGAALVLDGALCAPAEGLADVNLVADPAFAAVEAHWRSFHEAVRIGRDVVPQWQIADGHTAFLRLDVARRGRLDPVEAMYADPVVGAELPVAARRLRWSGLFASHRAVLEPRVELVDAAGAILARSAATVPAWATGGRNPNGYARLGATVPVPEGTAGARLILHLAPLADAEQAFGFFTDVQLAAAAGPPARPIADALTPLGPLLAGLKDGTLALYEGRLKPAPKGGAERPVMLEADGRTWPLGARVPVEDVGRLTVDGAEIAVETGAWAGRASVLADGAWIADVVGAPSLPAVRHTVALPPALADGRAHRLELVAGAGRLALSLAVAAPYTTPWSRVVADVAPPIPGAGSPLAAHRYRALEGWAARAADAPLDEWTRAALPRLHDALVIGHRAAEPFPLRFARPEAPDASVVIPVHDGYPLTFIALAALAFAPVHARFEVIVVDDGSSDETAARLAEHDGLTVLRHDEARGFLHAANAGAAAARGRWIVHLNNDTEVTAGWLDALIAAAEAFAGAGIVGPKVIYPDGRLQDAGGLVDHNLEPAMIGRGGNAFDPRYSYAREVDYVSGAALMVEAALWREVGGFSEDYAPAYFEDTDLAFKAREAGRRVIYAPGAVVVHSEGGSHGVDEAAGVKHQQVLNAPVFKRRWAHRRPPQLPFALALDRNVTARVLFALLDVPRTDIDAGSLAAAEEIRLVQALGAKVTVLPRSMEYLPRYAEESEARGIELAYAPFHRSMADFLEARGSEFDAIYVTRFQVEEALLPAIRRYAPQAKLLLNLADLQFLREMRTAAASHDAALLDRAEGVRTRELAAIRAADVVTTYSDVEASVVLSHAGPDVRVVKVPWVQRVAENPAPFAPREGLAFLANYQHPPNAEAVAWFAAEVMPLLHRRRPELGFVAYGSYGPDVLEEAPGVAIGGRVQVLQEMFDRHRVFVVPLRSGAGVKGKVFQALGAGIPVVATPVAAEGIALIPGEHALVAENAQEFAEAVLRLHDDEALWTRLSHNARALIAERYGFEPAVRQMQAAFEAAGLYLPLRAQR